VQLKIATGKKNVSVIGIEQKDAAAAIILTWLALIEGRH
jgi:hypothetical protein